MSSLGKRFRTRYTRKEVMDHLDPDGLVTLGGFRDKASGSNLDGYWESWDLAPLYNIQRYQPDSILHSVESTLDELHQGPPYREGGDFRSVKFAITPVSSDGVWGKGVYTNKFNTRRYEGGFIPPRVEECFFGWTWNDIINSVSKSELEARRWLPDIDDWGYKGWKATKPKLERSGLYVFLREARDIPRMLETTRNLAKDFSNTWEGIRGKYHEASGRSGLYRTNKQGWVQAPKRASDQFLNQQFGWSPFISDVVSFCKTYVNGDQYITKLVNSNDRFVRRRVPLADWTESNPIFAEQTFPGNPVDGYSMPVFPVVMGGDFFVAPPTWSTSVDIHHVVSAVGKFKFYNPIFGVSWVKDGSSALQTVLRYLTIYGLRVTPSNVWKAMPWTWLIDWFVDFSRYIDAINDSLVDQVACDYYYVKYHRVVDFNYTLKLPFASGTQILRGSLNVDTKERMSASSPYDFKLGWNTLSPRQLAILAALKITH